MWLVPIQVEIPAGLKADEPPHRLCVGERWLEVTEVCDRWYEKGTHPEWPAADYLKVLASDGHAYLIKHDLECSEWYVMRRW
jgi:hypothetical protein